MDLFAGTGAVTFELLSRGAAHVTAVEKAATQFRFIAKVADILGCKDQLTLVKGDVFRCLASVTDPAQFVWADPPYDHPRFGEIPGLVLASPLMAPGTLFVMEHSKAYDFSSLPHFVEHRAYGSVNFSIFQIPQE